VILPRAHRAVNLGAGVAPASAASVSNGVAAQGVFDDGGWAPPERGSPDRPNVTERHARTEGRRDRRLGSARGVLVRLRAWCQGGEGIQATDPAERPHRIGRRRSAALFHGGALAVHSPALGAVGALICVSGNAVAVWARVDLGRNWGMPMTQKSEPELITSGPYGLVRHPIYSGLLVAMLGTALVTNLLGLAVVALTTGYFYYCASVEEKNLTATFPIAYPAYRSRTKMLIPYVL
jgi:protein-S-isoprenylcysteine O-methyltransferase Ste14